MTDKTILVIGTYDTKDDELGYLAGVIRDQGGKVITMDVSVLGDPSKLADYSKHQVAEEGGSSIEAAIKSGDENHAMQIMAKGAALLTSRLHSEGVFDGMIVLGGTMGTDLALDVCLALPLGVPKYVVSTVSFSPLIPAERLAADTQMILWAGGLYGLNSVCKASLSQAESPRSPIWLRSNQRWKNAATRSLSFTRRAWAAERLKTSLHRARLLASSTFAHRSWAILSTVRTYLLERID